MIRFFGEPLEGGECIGSTGTMSVNFLETNIFLGQRVRICIKSVPCGYKHYMKNSKSSTKN